VISLSASTFVASASVARAVAVIWLPFRPLLNPKREVEDRIRIAVGVPCVPDCRSERRAVHERNNPW